MQVGKAIMLQRPQEFDGFRKSIIKDVDFLAPRLRFEDKREILDGVGLTPHQALLRSYDCSEICLTMLDKKDVPLGMFGVSADGAIWLLATPDIKKVRYTFLRRNREVVNLLNHKYRILWNYVDSRNDLHIKWLKWCGFKFLRKINYGVNQKPFYEFIKICVSHHKSHS